VGLGKINSIIAELGHELTHALIFQKYFNLGMSNNTQDYLASLFQADIWKALGNTANSEAYANRADTKFGAKSGENDFSQTQADDFIKAGRMPAIPQPPCR
jgi:hypothetical protein